MAARNATVVCGMSCASDHRERYTYTRERHKVETKFAQVAVELSGETKTGADTTHHLGYELQRLLVG